jgi:hypothetical protein
MQRIALDHVDLGRRYGIHFMQDGVRELSGLSFMDPSSAYDAQPALVTTANSGVPSLFTTYVDPRVIEVLVRPTKAAELYGEQKKGTWVSDTIMFLMAERTGLVSSYGDFSNDGMSNANVQFPQRQSYHYQTNTRWGQRELARMAEAKIDWANQVNMGSVLALNKYQNLTYLYGVAGLQCYGGTNDPSLPAPIAPTSSWFGADAAVIYGDMLRLVQEAIAQGNGLIDAESPFRLGISPGNVTNFNNTTQYNVNVFDQLKKNFPNMKIITIPEFAVNGGGGVTGGTELVQLICEGIEGQPTCTAAFTEKMRSHAMITKTSSWEQKKSQGTWGVIIWLPVAIAQMYGA